MLNRLGLNESAASRSKRQRLDHLLTVTAPHERIILAGLVLLVLLLLAWAMFGRIAHHVAIDGVLIKPGPRLEVVSAEQGHLLEVLVLPGDQIEAGDPVARQTVPELERETKALRDRLELLEREADAAGEGNTALESQLDATRVALLRTEALRSSRELIVSHVAGEVMTLPAMPGEYLLTGRSVALVRNLPGQQDGPFHAVLRVEPRLARRIEPGMQASVAIEIPGEDELVIGGEVISVEAGPLPNWLADLAPATGNSLSRINVALLEVPELALEDGTACRVRVRIGQNRPFALFAPERP